MELFKKRIRMSGSLPWVFLGANTIVRIFGVIGNAERAASYNF